MLQFMRKMHEIMCLLGSEQTMSVDNNKFDSHSGSPDVYTGYHNLISDNPYGKVVIKNSDSNQLILLKYMPSSNLYG